MIIYDETTTRRPWYLVCDGCGSKETNQGFETEKEMILFHSPYTSQGRGRLGWLFDGRKHWCPYCRVSGW